VQNNAINFSSAQKWFKSKNWKPFPFQLKAWEAYAQGESGMVNAPTGCGKSYALCIPILLDLKQEIERSNKTALTGLKAIWISPIRALTKELRDTTIRAAEALDASITVGIRTGDTTPAERKKQKEKPPNILITTPESIHVLMASKGMSKFFGKLKIVVVDEWHELIGSKRGVQVELFLSHFKGLNPNLKVWGISATIGNMDEAINVLHGIKSELPTIIKSKVKKKIEVISIMPDTLDTLPWAGHLGIRMIDKIIPILKSGKSTLLFTNTRAQAEIWYQKILDVAPELSGICALHHGSINREIRNWVEDELHSGKLKVVVCTSSLDLGVDFRPVETVIQVGSPKGVARFMQRAGRSGHQPGAVSKIYFVPTHSLELMEAAALRTAMEMELLESRLPFIRSFDVLVQYAMTLAVGDGFDADQIYEELIKTVSFNSMTRDEWNWILHHITVGGDALDAYDEHHKAQKVAGQYVVTDRRIAMRHRLSIGTIVSDVMLRVKYVRGKNLGTIEEYFVSRLRPGDAFWFAGRPLEMVRIRNMVVEVKKTSKKNGLVPSYQGGRAPLSSQMSQVLRWTLSATANGKSNQIESIFLKPLIEIQQEISSVPNEEILLIETFESKEGFHVIIFPFEGRYVHEGLGALIGHRISKLTPISFSVTMNDYGFELLSDKPIPIQEALEMDLFNAENLLEDIQASVNATEMARRKFRDVASISGLVFRGYPGKIKKDRHLQSSSQMFFEVFTQYDSDNLLLAQAHQEVIDFQLEEARLRAALNRIKNQEIVLKELDRPSPFGFPIMVDRLREIKVTTEKLEDRVKRLKLDLGV